MFGKVNKEEIQQRNESISAEMRQTKPDAPIQEEKKEHPAKNAIGNILSILGGGATIIAGVGAAFLALNYLVGAFGFSVFATIIGLIGLGFLCQYFGAQMITTRWIPIN